MSCTVHHILYILDASLTPINLQVLVYSSHPPSPHRAECSLYLQLDAGRRQTGDVLGYYTVSIYPSTRPPYLSTRPSIYPVHSFSFLYPE